MLHTTLIVIHAIAALACFGLGLIVINRPPQIANNATLFHAYLATLVLLVVFLLAVIIVDWSGLTMPRQITFAVLAVLALYMVFRGLQARTALQTKSNGWEAKFIGHVGFTLISLFDGFVIVTALDLKVPIWLILICAVVAVLLGIALLRSRIRNITLREPSTSVAGS